MTRLSGKAALLLTCFLPVEAFAHGSIEGIQGFYAGMLHPLAIPAHLVALVATGLLISQRPAGQVRLCLPAFLLTLGLGMTLSQSSFLPQTAEMEVVILGVTLLIGLVLAIIPAAPKWLAFGLTVTSGFVIGLDSNPEQPTLSDNLTVAIGIVVGCVILTGYLIIIENAIKVHWKSIALRIMGSWIAAASAMVVALRLV